MSAGLILILALAPALLLAGGPAYLSPTAVIANSAGDTLYVAEKTANQVAVVDAAEGKVLTRVSLPLPPTGLAISRDGSRLYVTGASPAGMVFVLDPESGAIVQRIKAGHTPGAPVLSPDGKLLYVLNLYGNTVSVIDLTAGQEVATIPVLREPVDAALTPDGKQLIVANLLPIGPANANYVAARVSIIDTASRQVINNIDLPTGSTAVQGVCLSPNGRFAYLVHIRGHFQLHTIQLDRGWMNTNALSVIDLRKQDLVNTVVLDDIDLGAANPWDIACTQDGQYLVIAHAGTHDVSVIDRPELHVKMQRLPGVYMRQERLSEWHTALTSPDLSFMRGLRHRVKLTGKGPRALALAGKKAYVAEYFSDSVGVLDIGPKTEARSIALGKPQPLTQQRRGEILFHDASDCFQQWQSCTTCHTTEGRPDGLNWDLLNDGIDNPKNTKSLLLAHKTPPAMITGVRDRAETAVRAGFKYILFSPATEEEASAVDAYLTSLKPAPSPYLVDGKLSAAAMRGEKLFEKAACDSCHPLPLTTHLGKENVGEGEFDTPTLIEVWRTAPYLHDGRASTIEEVLTKHNPNDAHGVTSGLSEDQVKDLAAYVLSL